MTDKIKQLLRDSKFDEAAKALEAALKVKPLDAQLHHLMAFTQTRLGQLEVAIKHAAEAAALAPDKIVLHFSLGELQHLAGRVDAARESFGRILKLDPNVTTAYLHLARMDMAEGKLDDAESRFKLALRTGENRSDVMAGYASLLMATDRLDDAIRYLHRGIEINPRDAACHTLLGRAYIQKRTFAFAEAAFRNALQLQPTSNAARVQLSAVLGEQKRFEEAVETIKPLLEKPDTAALGFATLGDLANAQGDIVSAGVNYNRALQINPRMPRVLEALAVCELKAGSAAAAAHAFELVMSLEPNNLGAERNRNQAMMLAGLLPEATQAYEHWLSRFPDDLDSRSSYASALELKGDFDAAEREVDLVLQGDGKNASASLLKARREMAQGQFAPARSRLAGLGNLNNAALQSVRFTLLGHTFDRTDEPAGAVKSWMAAQKFAGRKPADIQFVAPNDAVVHHIEKARALGPVSEDSFAPVFLLGMPGSGVESIAALIADLPNVALLTDRTGSPQRLDDFADPNFSKYVGELGDGEAQIAAKRYRRGLAHVGIGNETTLPVVDWLPHWNAHFLPLIHRMFAKPRFILVNRDPRDCLLNWLAFGSAIGMGFETPEKYAEHLQTLDKHFDYLRATHGDNVLSLDAAMVVESPQAVQDELAAFLAVDKAEPGANHRRLHANVAGLPIAFPKGAWERYQGVLGDAFARLA